MNTETINKRLKIISELQEELNKVKAIMEETLEDDITYQKMQEEAMKIKEEAKMKKEKVLATPKIVDFSDQIKKIREDMKEHKEMLAQELADYYKESGSLEIEDTDGNTKRIVFSVKLMNK